MSTETSNKLEKANQHANKKFVKAKPTKNHPNISSEYKLGVNGSFETFIKKVEDKVDMLGNTNEFIDIVFQQVMRKTLNSNHFDNIDQVIVITMPIEVAIAEKNPMDAINRRVMQLRRINGANGRELNAPINVEEENEAITYLDTIKAEYQTLLNAQEIAKLKLKSQIDRNTRFKDNFAKNLKVISATINTLLSDNIVKTLSTTAEYHDTILDGAIVVPSFTRNPISFLERINAVLLGLGSRAVTQTTSNEMRLKSRKLFDNAGQGPGEDLRTYIIRFDSVVSNLRKVYSDTFETSFNELEIVQRFLNSLSDKTAYTHYSNAATFGTASWPDTYQEAKLKVLESLDERRARSERATGIVFNTVTKKKNNLKTNVRKDKAENDNVRKDKVENDKNVPVTADTKGGNAARRCWICDSTDHMCRDCPNKGEHNLFSFIYMIEDGNDELCDADVCTIVLDSGATKSIYGSRELLVNISEMQNPVSVRTINSMAAINHTGNCIITGVETLYDPKNGCVNILSMNDLVKSNYVVRYNCEQDEFIILADDAVILTFNKFKGLYCAFVNREQTNLHATIYSDEPGAEQVQLITSFMTRENKEHEAYQLLERMSISHKQALALLRGNVIKDVPFEAAAVNEAIKKFGVNQSYVRGRLKMLNKNVKLTKEVTFRDRIVVGTIDIMYATAKDPFFVAYFSKEKLTFINYIQSNSAVILMDCIRKLKDILMTKRWTLAKLSCDKEGGFDVDQCYSMGIELEKLSTHLGDVDAIIKILKERARSIIAQNKYPLPRKLLRYLFAYCTLINNILPQWVDDSYMSPREFFMGRKVSFQDLKIGFGQYVEVLTDYKKHNDMFPRSTPALTLLPKLDDGHSWIVCCLDTGAIKTTSNMNVKVKMNDEILEKIRNLDNTIIADEIKLKNTAVFTIFHITYKKATALFGKMSADEAATKEINDLLTMNTWAPIGWNTFANLSCFVFFREKLDAAGNRIKIKARCVITKLQSAKVKAHHLKLYDQMNTSSPTPSWEVISIVLGTSASKRHCCVTIDIPFSFIWAENPNNHVMILDEYTTGIVLKLKPEWKSMSVPSKNGNKLKVKLLRNQYGLEEASLLWHELFSAFLINVLKFERNKFHKCVFTKAVDNEEHITAILYVDDLLLCGPNEQTLNDVINIVKSNFGDVHTSNFNEFDYLGVHVRINHETRSAELSCDDYIRRIISHELFEGKTELKMYKTPASSNIFEINEDSAALSMEVKEMFHSVVAKLLWISLRVRLDVLMPTAYLSSKVHKPTNHELGKLKRLVGYLKYRPMIMVVLNAEALINHGTIHAYCDAAHAVHRPSMKSHLGCFISLGSGPVALKSVGSKRMSTSSTNSEIYAFSLIISMLQGVVNFISSIGIEIKSVIIHEDNEAVIKLIQNDKPLTEGSRHMEIHRLYIKEELDILPDAKAVWCESEEMIADILTKALQGMQFEKLVLKMGICPVANQDT